jgi:hypothetical protein
MIIPREGCRPGGPTETWDFIIEELTAIKGKCGPDNGMGQINDYTVNMILAKMYLNHNAWFNNHSDDSWYGKAIDEVNEVINSGRFALAANTLTTSRRISPAIRRSSAAFPSKQVRQWYHYATNGLYSGRAV